MYIFGYIYNRGGGELLFLSEKKRFKFYWVDGKVEESEGFTVTHALAKLGHGCGTLRLLNYWDWEEIKEGED